MGSRRVPLPADAFVTVYESPDLARVYTCTPGLARLPGGRPNQGRIWTSDDTNLITFHTVRDFRGLVYT